MIVRARIAGRAVHLVDVLTHDDHGLVTEITIFSRPMSATAAFLEAVGPDLVSTDSRVVRTLVRVLAPLTPTLMRRMDRFLTSGVTQ